MNRKPAKQMLKDLGFSRYSGPSAAEVLRNLGLDIDPQRLDDRVAAVRSRARTDRAASVRRVQDLALAVKAARRNAELAHFDWKRSPTPARLAEVEAANRAPGLLEAEFQELCLHDQDLISNLTRWASR